MARKGGEGAGRGGVQGAALRNNHQGTLKTRVSSPSLFVSVIIPAKDEAHSIGALLSRVRETLSSTLHEIIVVDDGSTDKTREIARSKGASLVVSHPKNLGKGAAMKTGVRRASGDIIVFLDADGAHDAEDIPAVIRPIQEGKADFVIGSRSLPGSRVASSPFHRRLTNNMASFTISTIVSVLLPLSRSFSHITGRSRPAGHPHSKRQPNRRWTKITDCTSGFRAISKEAWNRLELASEGFEIEAEMIYEAAKNNLAIIEAPIACHWDSNHSHLSVFGDGFVTLKLLVGKLANTAKGSRPVGRTQTASRRG
ncbi:MAG: glycosyltransferase family 2 protein [Chloroflexi bacterium]|nr:glycosyltransferase family 2 protein [Chloroflexota bacterium]